MSWGDTWTGAQNAREAAQKTLDDPNNDLGYLGGFVSSAVSSLPELVGAEAWPSAQVFRAKNPIGGFVSQALPALIPYGAAFRLSEIPRVAALLEGGTARALGAFGATAESSPILAGATKEILRYAPLELSRLGVGLAVAPTHEDYGNLMADVGLSTLLAGGFGGIGGYFRSGGKLLPQLGRVRGADMALKPAFDLRMALTDGAEVSGDFSIADYRLAKTQEALVDTPATAAPQGAPAPYVHNLEGGDEASTKLINDLFKFGQNKGGSEGLDRRLLTETPATNFKTIDPGGQDRILGALGMKDMSELASQLVYPREVVVKSQRAAGTLAKAIDDSPAMMHVGPGTFMAREADSGLWVVAKRIEAGAAKERTPEMVRAPRQPKKFGGVEIANGDRFIIGKTDKPQLFVPDAHKVAESTVAMWSRFRTAFQPSTRDDVFNRTQNMVLDAVLPQEYNAVKTLGKKAWTTQVAERLSKTAGEMTGLAGSRTMKETVDTLYDVLQTTMFKEARNPVFGRLYAMLNVGMHTADSFERKIIQGLTKMEGSPNQAAIGKGLQYVSGFEGHTPVRELLAGLNPEERRLIGLAARTQTPAEDLAKLTSDGVISTKATQAYQELQAIDKSAWEKVLLPAFKNSELEGKFNLLDGHIGLSRAFNGDFYSKVVDESGKLQWLAVGKNGGASGKEAQTIIDEAASRGLNWKIADQGLWKHAAEHESGELKALSDLVADRVGKSPEVQDIVQSALRRLDAGRKGLFGGKARAPATLTHGRTGTPGSPDIGELSLDDMTNQIASHYKRLMRFAAYHTWQQRWGQEAFNLSKTDKTLYDDLMRKGQQFMGVEGQITSTLNKVLTPLFGSSLGGKAATRIAQGTNALMYAWNIGIANPTHAIMNLLSPLQTVAPWIAYTTRATTEEVSKHMHFVPHFGADGKPLGVAQAMSPMKVMGAALRDMGNPPPESRRVVEELLSDGTLQARMHEDFFGNGSNASHSIRDTFKHQGAWEGIKKTSYWMAEKTESYSRMISAMAAIRVGQHHFGLEGEQLTQFVRRAIHVNNYGYSVVDRSRLFTGPVGSMFGLFKNWQMNFIGQMMQYARVGMTEGVWSPLIWQGASALALGGLGAAGPLKLMADGLANWQGHSSSFLWLQEHWGKTDVLGHSVADEIYFGLPSLLGASLQASNALPGTDVVNDLSTMSSFVFIERAKAAGKALGAALDYNSGTGQDALRDPNIRDQLLAAFAPRAVFRGFSAMEGDYVKSMGTGYPQVRGLGFGTKLLYGLGLNQLDVDRQQVAARELYQDQEATRLVVSGLGQQYAAAMDAGDSNTMQHVIDQALLKSVPISAVMQSAQTRGRREHQSDSLSRFSGLDVERYRRALGQ